MCLYVGQVALRRLLALHARPVSCVRLQCMSSHIYCTTVWAETIMLQQSVNLLRSTKAGIDLIIDYTWPVQVLQV